MLKQNRISHWLSMALRLGLLSLMAASNFSCAKGKVASKLEVTFSNKSPYLLDGTATSCTAVVAAAGSGDLPAADIGPKYFSITNPIIKWSDTARTVSIILMRVKINSPALGISDYVCNIFDPELSAFYGSGASSLWSGVLPKAVETSAGITPSTSPSPNSICAPKIYCGGVSPGNNIDGNTSATLEVLATATEDDGTEIPVRYETTFTVQNLK